MTLYLSVAEVISIHEQLIELYGGAHGLRDEGQLVAAVFRPQSGYYSDLIAEAAALWESLSQNHPFIDGNKRIAFAACYTFLETNGILITADGDDIYAFLISLYETNSLRQENLEAWLRVNTKVL